MAAVGAVQVRCPECDVVIPIGMVAKSSTREGDKLIVNVEPDLVDAMGMPGLMRLAKWISDPRSNIETDIGGILPHHDRPGIGAV